MCKVDQQIVQNGIPPPYHRAFPTEHTPPQPRFPAPRRVTRSYGVDASSDQTPKEFVAALGHKTIVVVMYQPTSSLDERTLKQVRSAVSKVPNVLLLTYAVGEYKKYGDLPERVALLGASPSVAVLIQHSSRLTFGANIRWTSLFVRQTLRGMTLLNRSSPISPEILTTSSPGMQRLARDSTTCVSFGRHGSPRFNSNSFKTVVIYSIYSCRV